MHGNQVANCPPRGGKKCLTMRNNTRLLSKFQHTMQRQNEQHCQHLQSTLPRHTGKPSVWKIHFQTKRTLQKNPQHKVGCAPKSLPSHTLGCVQIFTATNTPFTTNKKKANMQKARLLFFHFLQFFPLALAGLPTLLKHLACA